MGAGGAEKAGGQKNNTLGMDKTKKKKKVLVRVSKNDLCFYFEGYAARMLRFTDVLLMSFSRSFYRLKVFWDDVTKEQVSVGRITQALSFYNFIGPTVK